MIQKAIPHHSNTVPCNTVPQQHTTHNAKACIPLSRLIEQAERQAMSLSRLIEQAERQNIMPPMHNTDFSLNLIYKNQATAANPGGN